jgi:maltose O-acetyltransferase
MTEKEKMLQGLPYVSSDQELAEERLHAKTLLHHYNLLSPDQLEKRKIILKQLLGKCGEQIHIEPLFQCD